LVKTRLIIKALWRSIRLIPNRILGYTQPGLG